MKKGVWLLATVALVLLTYLPQLGSPLELQDDHRIIEPAITAHPPGIGGALSLWTSALSIDVTDVGRFRPMGQIFDVVGPLVFGTDPLVWHSFLLVIAVSVAVTFFFIGWKVFGSGAAAAVMALIILLAPDPGPTAAWYRLGPKEAWSTLLLGLTLLVMVHQIGKSSRRLEALFIFLAALCSLTKESFVLLLPALIGLRVHLESRAEAISLPAAWRRVRWTTLILAVLFVVEVGAIVFVVRTAGAHSYGGESLALSGLSIAMVVARDLLRAPMLAVWFIPVLLAVWSRWSERRIVRGDVVPVFLFFAWIVPQYALYATRGGFWDHYWLPCIVAFAAANAAGIAALSNGQKHFLLNAALCATAIWTLNAIRIDMYAVKNFKTRASVQQQAVRMAAESGVAGSTLLVVGGKAARGERAFAFGEFVEFGGGRYRSTLLKQPQELAGTPMDDVSAIAYVDPGADAPPPAGFRRHDITGSQEFLSLRVLRRTVVPFTLRVDIRQLRGPA